METHPDAVVAAPLVLDERRRAGRVDDASPELIDLLRGGSGKLLSPAETDDTSPLSGSRGIKKAILLSAPIWALALVLTVWLLR
jgi:hypothetical protein